MAEREIDLTREIFAEIRITFYKDGEIEAAWPDDEMVARALIHKANAALEKHLTQQAMLKMAEASQRGIIRGDARLLKKPPHNHGHG